jgi:uncharacterized protein YaaN involved in tellurite resistance
MDNNIFEFFFNKLSDEEKENVKKITESEDFVKMKQDFDKGMDKISEDFSDSVEKIKNSSPKIYKGESEFKVNDSEGQNILNKYLPRELNSHAKDMLNIFLKRSFNELRESTDRYPESAFWSDPLNWVFLAYDPDFQKFLRKDNVDIDDLVNKSDHNRQIFREVLTYLYSIEM